MTLVSNYYKEAAHKTNNTCGDLPVDKLLYDALLLDLLTNGLSWSYDVVSDLYFVC